jgi:hypothetical protein
MNEKPYRLYIAQLKELKGAVVIEEKITEEQFAWIVNYIRQKSVIPKSEEVGE